MKICVINIKSGKVCAFCEHWYDPTNSAISPRNIASNFWNYDRDAKNTCALTNLPKQGGGCCPKYRCKLPIR